MAGEVMGAVTHTLELMCVLPLVFRSKEHIFCLIGSGGAFFFNFSRNKSCDYTNL